jgi:hypothetical protein
MAGNNLGYFDTGRLSKGFDKTLNGAVVGNGS